MIFGTTDPSVPMTAPHGYKWRIRPTDSHWEGSSRPLFALELWLIEHTINDDLFDPEWPQVEELFERSDQIRRTSKKAIRALDRKRRYDAEAAVILGKELS